MSVPITKFVCSTLMAIVGIIVVKNISNSKEKLLTIKNISLMLCLIILPGFMYTTEYTYLYTITIYLITIVTYKYVLNISFLKSIISCTVMLFMLIIMDFISMCICVPFMTAEQARDVWYINLIVNIIFSGILLILFNHQKVKEKASYLVEKLENRKETKIVVFSILVVTVTSIIVSIASSKFNVESIFNTNFLIMVIIFLLVIILIEEQNSYGKLSDEYDNLFNYVKIFEDWIEEEQLNRHEYKNQLAVLRCMTKEKKVKEKIDSIIRENINIDNKVINQLKDLPNGGFKGLLYYKIVVARNQKINIEVDVSLEETSLLNKLNQEELKILSKIIGIYADNAIEAAKETKKKIVSIEIYEYDKIANIVISNTYKKEKLIANRTEKGASTKGEGRGNGLYFAKKILSKNLWIEEKQEIIDNFYIEQLKIIKKEKSK